MQTFEELDEDLQSSSSSEDRNVSPFKVKSEIYLFSNQFDITKISPMKKVESKKLKSTPTPKPAKQKLKQSMSPKKKTQQKKPKMRDIKPINLENEKINFFLTKCVYNPQFEYADKQHVNVILFKTLHSKYFDLAMKILRGCIKDFGSEEQYSEVAGGRLLTRQETEDYFNLYIEKLGVQAQISYEFQENTVAPTSVVHNPLDGTSKVIIGLPLTYREKKIEGVLNHEIGTHFIRKSNDKQQIWYKKRNKYHLEPYIKNEEGLAVLNQLVPSAVPPGKPYLFMAALHYISAIMASQMSFQQLYHELGQFIQDDQKRFRECVRVKRGLRDTSQPGGMYKDQVYLIGARKILKYREQLNFIHLHSGKITAKDCIRLSDRINTKNVKLPLFLTDMVSYKRALDYLARVNFM